MTTETCENAYLCPFHINGGCILGDGLNSQVARGGQTASTLENSIRAASAGQDICERQDHLATAIQNAEQALKQLQGGGQP